MISIVQTKVLDIFSTDSKTLGYLNRRLDLSDDEFLAAATKQRPSNKKLKDYISDRRIHMEQLPTEENATAKTETETVAVVETSDEEVDSMCRGDKFLIEACDIFKNDKGTLKRIMKGVNGDLSVLNILWSAKAARPKNKKILALIDAYEALQEKNDRIINKVKEDKKVKEDYETPIETTTINYDTNEYILLARDVFKNDKNTLKKIEKAIESKKTINDILFIVASARPTNVRYGRFWNGPGHGRKDFPNDPTYDPTKFENSSPEEKPKETFSDSYANTVGKINQKEVTELTEAEQKEIQDKKLTIEEAKQAEQDEATAIEQEARDKRMAEQTVSREQIEEESEEDGSDKDIQSAENYRPKFNKYSRQNTYKSEKRYDDIKSDDDEDYSDLVEEFSLTLEAGKYDDVTVADISDASEKFDFDTINVKESLREIFQNDKGTLRGIEKKILSETLDDDLLEYALSKRPKNRKLLNLIDAVSNEAIKIEEIEDEEDANKIHEGTVEATKYAAYADMKVSEIPYVKNDNQNITMYLNGEMEVINNEHPNFQKITECLEEARWNDVFPLLDLRGAISKLVYKQLEFKNDSLYFNGEELDGALVEFIINMAQHGADDIQPFMRFLNKVQKNPSVRAQKELYGFLRSGKIPITQTGNILTYKRIKSNWKDCHSNTIDNSIGKVVRMKRLSVDNNSNNTCSTGLHVCSYSYLGVFGGNRIVVCEVHPRDVVSIPTDYNNSKMRCCKYKVIKEVSNNTTDILSLKPVYFD